MSKNTIIVGLLFGLLTPIFGYYLIEALFDLFAAVAYPERNASWSFRTLTVFALCMNLIPFHIFKTKDYNESLRGVVFPTVIYVCIWVFYFWETIFTG